MGVYANGERKINGVPAENLGNHILYNIQNRWGRAFFLDGVCIYKGYLSWEQCWEIEKELKEKPLKIERDTAPYV